MRLPEADSEAEGPNLTPVIDIVFLLLIFFLVATRFHQEEKHLPVQLASAVEPRSRTSGARVFVINVTKEGQYVFRGQKLNRYQVDDLIRQDKQNNPQQAAQSVQIRPDHRTPFGPIAVVMGICRNHDIEYTFTVKEARQL